MVARKGEQNCPVSDFLPYSTSFPPKAQKTRTESAHGTFQAQVGYFAFEGKSPANRALGHLCAKSQKAALCEVVPVSAACFYVFSSSVRFIRLFSFLSKVKTVFPFSE